MVHGAPSLASANREQRGQRTLSTIGVCWRKPGPRGAPLGCWAVTRKGLPQHWKSASMVARVRETSQKLEPNTWEVEGDQRSGRAGGVWT